MRCKTIKKSGMFVFINDRYFAYLFLGVFCLEYMQPETLWKGFRCLPDGSITFYSAAN